MKLETKLKAVLVTIAAFTIVALIVMAPVIAKADDTTEMVQSIKRGYEASELHGDNFGKWITGLGDAEFGPAFADHFAMTMARVACATIAEETGDDEMAEYFLDFKTFLNDKSRKRAIRSGEKLVKKWFFSGQYGEINSFKRAVCSIF